MKFLVLKEPGFLAEQYEELKMQITTRSQCLVGKIRVLAIRQDLSWNSDSAIDWFGDIRQVM